MEYTCELLEGTISDMESAFEVLRGLARSQFVHAQQLIRRTG